MAALTAMVGFWATLSLNIPDFSRYARSQRSQIIGQIIGLPLTMLMFAGLGVVLTAASFELVGETIADPINLIGKIDSPFWVVLAMLMIILATISTNTAANIVSPTNVFQNVAPKVHQRKQGRHSHRADRHRADELGASEESWAGWKRMSASRASIPTGCIGYSSLLGPIAGIMVVDYFLIKNQDLRPACALQGQRGLPGLEQSRVSSRLADPGEPDALRLIAITTGKLSWFYSYGWFTGSILGGLIYYFVARNEVKELT